MHAAISDSGPAELALLQDCQFADMGVRPKAYDEIFILPHNATLKRAESIQQHGISVT
jgi:hypothetical protein